MCFIRKEALRWLLFYLRACTYHQFAFMIMGKVNFKTLVYLWQPVCGARQEPGAPALQRGKKFADHQQEATFGMIGAADGRRRLPG